MPAPFEAIPGNFLHGLEKCENIMIFPVSSGFSNVTSTLSARALMGKSQVKKLREHAEREGEGDGSVGKGVGWVARESRAARVPRAVVRRGA